MWVLDWVLTAALLCGVVFITLLGLIVLFGLLMAVGNLLRWAWRTGRE